MSLELAKALLEAKALFRKRWADIAEKQEFRLEVATFDIETRRRHVILWEQLLEALRTDNYCNYLDCVEKEGRIQARASTRIESLLGQLSELMNLVWNVISDTPATQANPLLLRAFADKLNSLRTQAQLAIMKGFEDESRKIEVELSAETAEKRQIRLDHTSIAEMIKSISAFRIMHYQKGQTLFKPTIEERNPCLYFVLSGQIRLYQELVDGRAITLSLLSSSDVFARTTSRQNYYHDVYAEAMKDSTIAYIRESALAALMEQSPLLASRIIYSFSEQLSQSQFLIEGLLGRDVSVRLANLFLKLADGFGVSKATDTNVNIELDLTHQALADMIGSNRVTVTRKLAELQQKNLISIETNRTITIVNKKALQEMLLAG